MPNLIEAINLITNRSSANIANSIVSFPINGKIKTDPVVDLNKGLTYKQQADIQLKIIDEKAPEKKDAKADKKSDKKADKPTQFGKDKGKDSDDKSKKDGKEQPGEGKAKKEATFGKKGKPNDVDANGERGRGDQEKDKGTVGKAGGVSQERKAPEHDGDSDGNVAPIKVSDKFDPDNPKVIKIGKGNPVDLSPTLGSVRPNDRGDGTSRPVREATVNELSAMIKGRYARKATQDIHHKFHKAADLNKQTDHQISRGDYRGATKTHKQLGGLYRKIDKRSSMVARVSEGWMCEGDTYYNVADEFFTESKCPNCRGVFNGMVGKCPSCGTKIKVLKDDMVFTDELIAEAMTSKGDGLHVARQHNALVKKLKGMGELKKAMAHQKIRDRHLTKYFKTADVKTLSKYAGLKCESELSLNGYTFTVEWAAIPQLREQGLMLRDHLDIDSGMLFEFDTEEPRSMWMKNTFIPLDMVFLDKDGVVVNVAENCEPESLKYIRSLEPCKYVLEINAGLVEDCGIEIGMQIDELSAKKIKDYQGKAAADFDKRYERGEDLDSGKLKKRGDSLFRSGQKLGTLKKYPAKVPATEERLNELSKKTLMSYREKARKHLRSHSPAEIKGMRKFVNRAHGETQADKRIVKEYSVFDTRNKTLAVNKHGPVVGTHGNSGQTGKPISTNATNDNKNRTNVVSFAQAKKRLRREERVDEISNNKIKKAVYTADRKGIEAGLRGDKATKAKYRAQGDRMHEKLLKRIGEATESKKKVVIS